MNDMNDTRRWSGAAADAPRARGEHRLFERGGVTSTLVLGMTLLFGSTGCFSAHVYPKTSFEGNWSEDPAKDREMRTHLEALRLDTEKADESIQVFVDKIPAGLTLDKGVMSVDRDAPLEILGRAEVYAADPSIFVFPDYTDGWRKGLCYWQRPLMWMTIGLWHLVPIYYPCGVRSLAPKEEVINAARNLVQDLGGNMFVGTYVRAHDDRAEGIVGFVVRTVEPARAERSADTDI